MVQTNSHCGILAEYFPKIRTREEILETIRSRPDLNDVFHQWDTLQQEYFLDCCTGIRGMKILYDGIFKEIFNPEVVPERLEDLLSLLLGHDVQIQAVLPNDSVRLGAESSLLYTDIIVQLEDGSLSDIEIQKIGYRFPGERAACYSADHLLRQYKRVRGEKGKHFTYSSIKNVYTIVFFEKSPKELKNFPNDYLHKFTQKSDTGLTLELLQEYIFIGLDFFKKNMENKDINTDLDAWLAFLSFDDPSRIVELFTRYPAFKAMYQDIYDICQNVEEVMNMYSKELAELDRNTVKLMIDELQEELDQARDQVRILNEQARAQNVQNEQKDAELQALREEIARLKAR
jgi:hypothetical protein